MRRFDEGKPLTRVPSRRTDWYLCRGNNRFQMYHHLTQRGQALERSFLCLLLLGRDRRDFGALLFRGAAEQFNGAVGCILERLQHKVGT